MAPEVALRYDPSSPANDSCSTEGFEMSFLSEGGTPSAHRESDEWEFDEEHAVTRDFGYIPSQITLATDPSQVFTVLHRTSDDSHLCSDARTFVNCFISFVGVGILGLPYAFCKSGIYGGSLTMTVIAILSTYCMLLVVRCKYKLKDKNASTYGDVGFYAIGRWGQILVEASLVLTQTGFCTAYLIFILSNLHDAFPSVSRAAIMAALVPLLVLLSLIRHLKNLAPFSVVADVANIVGLSVVYWADGIHFADDIQAKGEPAEFNLPALPFFFGVAIYCYEGIGMVLPLENAMRNKHHFQPILAANMLLVTFLFISFGLCGYLAFGQVAATTLHICSGTVLSIKSCSA